VVKMKGTLQSRRGWDRAGVTLVELLVAIGVLLVSGIWLLSSYKSSLELTEIAQQETIAFNDIRAMLERIKTTPFANLQADFPNGAPNGVVGGGAEKYSVIIGGYTLGGEQVTVTHSPSQIADPRELIVQVDWTNRGRAYQRSASTIRASKAS
jgi:type II secretory pathway pseudopilin PulG